MSTENSLPQEEVTPVSDSQQTPPSNRPEVEAEQAPAAASESSAAEAASTVEHVSAETAAPEANPVEVFATEAPAASVEAVESPVPVVAEATSAELAASETVETPPAVEAEEPAKRKVTLNPTATPEVARPVPSLSGAPVAPENPKPVELPAANDEELEADVARALSVESTAPQQAASSDAIAPAAIPAAEQVDASIEAAIAEALGTEGTPASAETTLADPEDLMPGDKLTGTVQSVSGDSVFLDFGLRLSGVVATRSFGNKHPSPGDQLEVLFEQINEAEGLIVARLPGGTAAVHNAEWEYLSKGQMVECLVKKTNKGGLEVTVGSLRGFIPASQVDVGFIEDMETFVGKKVTAEITELKPEKKNLVLSRRKVINARRAETQRQMLDELKADEIRSGTVKTIKDYGAFIDLGGVDGFLPISQMSWIRIEHPSEILAEGQQVDIKVLSIDREKKKISLGMRQLTQNPWKVAESKYEKGSNVTGRVTKTETFGAFVELEPGIEGLIHISELEHRRVKRVTEVVNVGDVVEIQVLEVDPAKKRISLSMKALHAKPEPVEKPKDEDLAPGGAEKYQRTRKGPLLGGKGPSTGKGGLFGNPKDFER